MELRRPPAGGARHRRQRHQQVGYYSLACGLRAGRPVGGSALQHGNGGAARVAGRGSDAWKAVYGADEVPVKTTNALVVVLGASFWVLRALAQEPSIQNPAPGTAPARDFVATYCVSCHNPKLKAGSF